MGQTERGPLGEYVRSLRVARGWTQTELGEKAGLPRSTVDAVERGDARRPRAGVLDRLASVLEVPVEEILRRAGLMEPGQGLRRSPDQLAKELLSVLPLRIPAYDHYPHREEDPVRQELYVPRDGHDQLAAYVVSGEFLLPPTVLEGDTVIVDAAMPAEEGDIVIAAYGTTMAVGRLTTSNGKKGIQTAVRFLTDCTDILPITEVHHHLK